MAIRWPVSTAVARRHGALLLRMVANVPLGARGRYNMDGNQVSDGCEVRHMMRLLLYICRVVYVYRLMGTGVAAEYNSPLPRIY